MIITTHLPDGTRDVFPVPDGADPAAHAWAVVVTGNPALGHIAGAGWTLWRYTATQENARELAEDLERTCRVERTVVVPTIADAAGPPWTAIGFWDDEEIQLVGVVAGCHEPIGGEDVSAGGPWSARVYAGNPARALLEAYRALDEAAAARR